MISEMTAPLHSKVAEFRRLGLFSGIKDFSELERRIEALTDEKRKGDAFEIFAEAYLATQRVRMAKHVWPDKAIPPSIRKRLRLSPRDVGADGVIETIAGNLPIRKRLFLTATPRHYDLKRRDAEGEPVEVFSMNRPEIYGPVVHTLSFAEAAKQKIICNYKVVIAVVTSAMLPRVVAGLPTEPPRLTEGLPDPVTGVKVRKNPAARKRRPSVNDQWLGRETGHNVISRQQLRHGTVLVSGDEVTAQQVAHQIALAQAVAEHRLKKIFTFHRNVATARSFTGEGSEGIGTHLPDFAALHVNGAMSTAARDGLMAEFKAARQVRRGGSNARCQTEGIDVPTVDMVAFLTPKRSKVDIVSAAADRPSDAERTVQDDRLPAAAGSRCT